MDPSDDPSAAPAPAGRPAGAPPTHAGRCELREEIGRGGMGAVLAGRDPALDRPLAVKVLLPDRAGDADLERRFLAEAQICGRLQHPGVVPVHDVGRLEDGRPYFTMKLVKGRTLAGLLAERKSPADDLPRWVGVFEQVCQAVAYAHSRGVIHRDLKPANVMVGEFGEVQVMDWGLAKVLTGAAPASAVAPAEAPPRSTIYTVRTGGDALSRDGTVLGTPAYMAPEQARGEVDVLDARADVFGLGAVLCVILTGNAPFGKAPPEETRRRSARGDLEDAFARLDGCGADAELVRLAKACLDPWPERRPADAEAVAQVVMAHRRAVEARLRAAELAGVAAQERALRERQRRRWTLALAASMGLTLAVAAAGGWLWQRQRDEADRKAAAVAAEAGRQAAAMAAAAEADLDAAARDAAAGEDGRAREALERAEGRLAGGGPAELRDRLRRLRDDLDFAAELEMARMKGLELTTESTDWNWAGSDAAYAKAFAARGLDVAGPGAGAALERIGRSSVKARLVTALDDWADARRMAGAAGWEGLLEAAGRADDSGDQARRRLREAVVRHDLGRLKELAGDPGLAEWPPADAVLLANGLLAARDRGAAVQVLRAAQGRNPGDYWLNVTLGLYLGDSSPASREESIGFQRAAVAARPREAAAHNDLGVLLDAHGQAAEAEKEYREALRLKPDLPQAHINLGIVLQHKGKPAEAEAEYREALRIKPDYPAAHDSLGVLRYEQGRAAAAEAEYREALRINPHDSSAHNHLGYLLAEQGKPAEAEAECREALRIRPDYADAHNHLGIVLAAEGKPAEAEKEYREAMRLKPDLPDAHNNLGIVLQHKGKPAEAEKEYREALRLKPDYAEAHNNLGTLLHDQGKPAEAEKEYREALRIKADFAEAHYCLGVLRYKQGRAAEAEAEYREALRIEPDKPEAHCNLGLALRDQGRFREALEELRRGHELGSRNPRWRNPSADWVEECQRLIEWDALLSAVLGGAAEPADPDAILGFAHVCYCTRRYAAAARLAATAMDAAPETANGPHAAIRLNAARCAALAGCGQGSDAPSGDAERARLRGQALAWLRDDLAWWAQAAASGDPNARAAVKGALAYWQEVADLSGVRDADALEKLPAAERAEWRKLWADVDTLLQKTAPQK
jgi:serine/threonine-protein kinase